MHSRVRCPVRVARDARSGLQLIVVPRGVGVIAASGVRRRASNSLHLALGTIGLSSLLTSLAVLALLLAAKQGPTWTLIASVAVSLAYIGIGLLAWWRRPSSRMGLLILTAGYAFLVSSAASLDDRWLVAMSVIVASSPLAVVVWMLHAFPSGRLPTRLAKGITLSAWFVAIILGAPLYLFSGDGAPFDLLVVADRPDIVRHFRDLQHWAGALVLMATAAVLVDQVRRADTTERRVLIPVYLYGLLAALFVPVSTSVGPWLHIPAEEIQGSEIIVLLGIPVAFALGMLRGGYGRTSGMDELGEWLGVSDKGREGVSSALARTLGDSSVRLLFDADARFVDSTGQAVKAPNPGSGRALVEIHSADRRVGAIEYDAMLNADPELVRKAGRVVAIAVERERLVAELLATEDELRLSRSRIVESADSERKRMARNLHDGLQVRMVLLAMAAQEVADDADASAATKILAQALRGKIDDAAAELRSFVYSVMPPVLTDRGLLEAVEDLVDHVSVPIRLNRPSGVVALDPVVERTAYFVVAEGLANALKYARPAQLEVRLTHEAGWLTVEICDDGIGGALVGAGSGLQGLYDRVDALGGRLTVESPVGEGTRLVAELPCA